MVSCIKSRVLQHRIQSTLSNYTRKPGGDQSAQLARQDRRGPSADNLLLPPQCAPFIREKLGYIPLFLL